ncbi:MAG: type II secretion system F family protein [Candidatus Aenigmatarchaeota archaeon]
MDIDFSEEMELKTILETFPPVIATVFVVTVSALHPEPGMIGISIMFGIMIAITPYATWKYFRVKKIKAMEEEFPNFLRDLVEGKKSGLTITKALRDTEKNEYGELNKEVDKMSKQLSWGLSFDEVIMNFRDRVEESGLMTRTVGILMEAKRSGGNVVSAMETISSDASTLIELERERKSEMTQHAAVMYLIYLMFVAITIILSKILVPMTQMEAEGMMGIGPGEGGVCKAPMAPSEDVVCSMFESFADVFGLGVEQGAYYEGLFLSMILVQGAFSGLVIGQIRNNSATSGIKHSLILTGVGLVVYILAARYVELGIM